jgi:hypothetical protein
LLRGWFAPDITNDKRRGIGDWSVDDIVTYLRSGHNLFTAASGPMAEAIMDSTSKFADEDPTRSRPISRTSRPRTRPTRPSTPMQG